MLRAEIKTDVFTGCTFRGTGSAVDEHKGHCSCSSELHIQTVTMAEVMFLYNWGLWGCCHVVCVDSSNN